MTLPPRVGCTWSPGQELSFRIGIEALDSSLPGNLIEGGDLLLSVAICGKSKFYKQFVEVKIFYCPEERYYSSGQLGESLDLMNTGPLNLQELSWRFRGPVTLPSQGRAPVPRNLQELSLEYL